MDFLGLGISELVILAVIGAALVAIPASLIIVLAAVWRRNRIHDERRESNQR